MEATDEFVVDFPALFIVADWIEAHCIVPDGFDKGATFEQYDWQLWCTLNHYRLKPNAEPAGVVKRDGTVVRPASAFAYRRSQVIGPQKCGKGPWSATIICAEAVGPTVFTGWAEGGEVYDCAEHGCSCGWTYEYEPGEAMGTEWPTPLIQLLATAEDQTDNVYRPLQSMAKHGPLAERMRAGEEFIRLPNDGRIDVITSSARARLGNPVTFALQDESQLYTKQNGMIEVAETQRRGVAGMGGRSMETTNAPSRTVESVAKRTLDSKRGDIFRFHRPPPAHLSYRNKRDRRKIHRHVYAGCRHVDLDTIEGEAAELLEKDPAQAEQYFGNRMVAGAGTAFDADRWKEKARPDLVVPDKTLIAVGVDGARFDDALAIVATAVGSGHQWPLAIIERPEHADDEYEHDIDLADEAMLAAWSRWRVWRAYVDPQYIEDLFNRWQGRWGAKKVVPWWTYRQRQMAYALRAYRDAIAGDSALSHDGDSVLAQHIANATRRIVNVKDEKGRPMWLLEKPEPGRKIDGSMAGALSWEARGDAVAAGMLRREQAKTTATFL